MLHIAVHNDYMEIVKFLIEVAKAKTSIKDVQGKSVQDIVRESRNSGLISLFESLGINIQKRVRKEDDTSSMNLAKLRRVDPQVEYTKMHHKSNIHKFILGLFGIEVSDHALVDITISESPDDNQVLIVGRPQVLGSAIKQMRHITPYAFLKDAIIS